MYVYCCKYSSKFIYPFVQVSHVIIDGVILTDRVRERKSDKEWEANEDVRLNPESIAEVRITCCSRGIVGTNYIYSHTSISRTKTGRLGHGSLICVQPTRSGERRAWDPWS